MRQLFFCVLILWIFGACTDTSYKVPPPVISAPPLPEILGEPNQAQQGGAFSIGSDAFYQANQPQTSSPGVVISLHLTPKGRYEMTTQSLDKSPVKIDSGSWKTLKNGNLSLNYPTLALKDSTKLEFETAGDKLVYKGSEYGFVGLVLLVKPLPKVQ